MPFCQRRLRTSKDEDKGKGMGKGTGKGVDAVRVGGTVGVDDVEDGARVAYYGVTLNVARPDMNNYATLGVMLY